MNIKTNEKIRIKLESFNHELLNSSCQKIINILQNTQLDFFKIVSLPTKKRIYCVLRSPHVDKDSREHFEIRVYKKVIDLSYSSKAKIFDLLDGSDLPIGVFCKIILDP
jgi:small subunit ribosomal protein S10